MLLKQPIYVSRVSYTGPLGKCIEDAFRNVLKPNLTISPFFPPALQNNVMKMSVNDFFGNILNGCIPEKTVWASSEYNMPRYSNELSSIKPFNTSSVQKSALGCVSLELVQNKTKCCIKAVCSANSFRTTMIEAAALVDKVDYISAYADGLSLTDHEEIEAAEIIGAPLITSLKGNIGNAGEITEFINLALSIRSLISQIVPFTRNGTIMNRIVPLERNIAGGQSLKFMIFNTKCLSTGKYYSILLENLNMDERGRIGRDIRYGVYSQ